MIDSESRLGRPAAAHGQIILLHVPAHQRLAQRTGGLTIERQQQAATGRAIKAMHQEDRPAQLLAEAVGEEVVLAAGQLAVMDHQAGSLVDNGQDVVLIENL